MTSNFYLYIIHYYYMQGLRWHVCGVTATAATATAGWDTHAYVAAMRGSRVLASGAARGFNCGLWMLFHFITGALIHIYVCICYYA